ncbi:MAG: hypothetical protein WKF48_12230 [Solirubrobacteraceae bacterium]
MGTDAGYHDRAQAVLGELGRVSFALAEPADADLVLSLAEHEQADVVVLDATGSESAVQAVLDTLSASDPRLGVVVVCEHLMGNERNLQALPKWGWTRDLRVAVQRARHDASPVVPRGAVATAARREPSEDARVRAARR